MQKILYKHRTEVIDGELPYPWYFNFPCECFNLGCPNYGKTFFLIYKGNKGDVVEFSCAYCGESWIQKIE